MHFPTPIDSASVAMPHPRGVFQDEHTFNGLVVYRVYDCTGELVEIASISARWNDANVATELEASLNARCPSAPHCHEAATLASPRLRLI
jgi:hypothetical protein